MRVRINKHIVTENEICHGKPTFRETRILVGDIVGPVAAGEPIEKIIEEYPGLNRGMIREGLWNTPPRKHNEIIFYHRISEFLESGRCFFSQIGVTAF